MSLPSDAHWSRAWRIHDLTKDFRLEDVWDLPVSGGPDDLARLVEIVASKNLSDSSSAAVRTLVAIRWKLGAVLGLDRPDDGLGARVPTLRDRLPADLRDGRRGPEMESMPLRPLYLTSDEWAAEAANRTMHGVMHLGWVSDGAGSFHARLAILVKPNGLLGSAYMAAIKPFRHLIVYPALLRELGEAWAAEARSTSTVP